MISRVELVGADMLAAARSAGLPGRYGAAAWRRHAVSCADDRKRLFPGSVALPVDIDVCPLHGCRVGPFTRMCLQCHTAAWEWTATR